MALRSTKRMILPVVDETFAEHFTARTWDSPQDQIDATYPRYIQPTNPTALFVYTHDVGTVIDRDVLITVIPPVEQVVPSVSMTSSIEVSADGVTWGDPISGFQVFTGNFRYIRVSLSFAADDDHELAVVGPVRLRVSLKKKREEGSGTSSATDPTVVTLRGSYIDLRSIRVTAKYNPSYPVVAVYDDDEIPYPTEFRVYCFRTDTGAQVANDFSWEVTGV